MQRFGNHVPGKAALLAPIIIVVTLSQQINATGTSSAGQLKKAQALLDHDEDKAALACLNTLIRREPKNALAFSKRSLAHHRGGEYDKALEDSNKAIALDPKLAMAYV